VCGAYSEKKLKQVSPKGPINTHNVSSYNVTPQPAFLFESLNQINLRGTRVCFFNVLREYRFDLVTQLLHQQLHIYKIYKMYTLNIKNAPTCFGPKTILRELYLPC